ncbi:MAG: cobalamin B12-binding domain-containing protein, partial [Pseudomonadota bacterium]
MRVLFIYRMVYQDPLGVLYLASVLKRAGHEVHYIDAVLDKNWEENAVRLAPDIVGYSVLTGNQRFYLEINSRLKKQIHFLSVWGGPHP